MSPSLPARAILAAAAALVLALSAPLAASAHVSVTPAEAEPGGFAQLTFRVPNERDDAGTVRLELTLPTETPFASVSYQPVAGWTTTVATTPLPQPVEVSGNELTDAVTSIVWEAEPGAEIAPGQYQTFGISVGPVPDVGSIPLPVQQTYASGEVVDWSGGPDDELPAPVLYVGDEPAGHSHGGAEETVPGTASVSADDTRDDGLARGLGLGGLALGAIAVVVAAFALARPRRSA